jgi:hypothetical protein
VKADGVLALVVLLAADVLGGCDGCRRKSPPKKTAEPATASECTTAEDCDDDNPCTEADCDEGRCVVSYVPAGFVCDAGSVCEGVAECDGRGRCMAGEPPVIDDGNPCTTDACDPVRGVVHNPVDVDDSDECTIDACDPRTGNITHEPVDIDDGDDCTFDLCDPETGISHRRPEPTYTCEASCGPGYHSTSRTESPACPGGLQSHCAPDCGTLLYTCDSACPPRYKKVGQSPSPLCGPVSPILSSCVKQ